MTDNPNGGQSRNSARESADGKEDPQQPECHESGLDDDKDDPSEDDKCALRSTPNPRETFLGLPKNFFELRDQQRRQQQQQQKEQQQREIEEDQKSLELLLGYDNAALTAATTAKARSSTSALLTDAGGGQSTSNAPSAPSSPLPRRRHIRQLERPRRDDHEFFARERKLFGLGPMASVLGTGSHLFLRDTPPAHVANQQQQLQQPQPRARSTDATPEGGASGAVNGAGALRKEDGEEVGHARARRHAIHVVQQQVEGGGQTRQQAMTGQGQQQTAAAHSHQPANQVQHPHNHTSSSAEGGSVGEMKDAVDPRVLSGEEEEDDH